MMVITEQLIALHQHETGGPPTPDQVAELEELATDYRADVGSEWLRSALADVLGEVIRVRPTFFLRSNPDLSSYLAEATEVLGWSVEDEGEWVDLFFTKLGLRLHISHEAYQEGLGSGSSYQVLKLES